MISAREPHTVTATDVDSWHKSVYMRDNAPAKQMSIRRKLCLYPGSGLSSHIMGLEVKLNVFSNLTPDGKVS
jgi:hypothetical protein